jgi:putative flippase GtrA
MIAFARRSLRPLWSKRFIRFVFVGIANTALSYAVYAVMLMLGLAYAAANFIALLAGIVTGFKLQGTYVFRRTELRLFWRFVVCWALIYCFNIIFIAQMMRLGFNAYVGGAIALPFVTALSYVMQKTLVFRRPVSQQQDPRSLERR